MAPASEGHGHVHGSGGHDHHHPGGGHHHAHAPKDFGRAFAIGAAINICFVAIEAAFGLISGSMSLLADAGHNLSDVFSLLLAWGAAIAARRAPTARFTYGLRSSTILAALANAVLLLLAAGAIAWEAAQRLVHPTPVAGWTVIVVAGIGIVVNAATALMFMQGSREDINVRGAYLHMLADAGVSLAVVLGGVLIALFGWDWVDPALSLIVVVVIVWSTLSLLRESVTLAMDAVPAGIDPAAVRAYLAALPGVGDLHDLHIWPMSTTETALTCHLLMPQGHPGDAFLAKVSGELAQRFRIQHATLQIEIGDASPCVLAPEHTV